MQFLTVSNLYIIWCILMEDEIFMSSSVSVVWMCKWAFILPSIYLRDDEMFIWHLCCEICWHDYVCELRDIMHEIVPLNKTIMLEKSDDCVCCVERDCWIRQVSKTTESKSQIITDCKRYFSCDSLQRNHKKVIIFKHKPIFLHAHTQISSMQYHISCSKGSWLFAISINKQISFWVNTGFKRSW